MGAFIASGCGVTGDGFGMVLRIMSSNPSSVKNLTLHPRKQNKMSHKKIIDQLA